MPADIWRIDYDEIVKEILDHDEFKRLAEYYHHSTSILEHVKAVSHLSYVLCRRLGLDYKAAARAGLLHDFFLYDWREYKRQGNRPNHGLSHPKTALTNSLRHFQLDDREQDIILKHMWPKVFGLPRYLETWLVSLVDKYLAIHEFSHEFRRFFRRRKEG